MQNKANSIMHWALGLIILELLTLLPLAALATEAPIQPLNHQVVDAEYSKPLDRIVTVSAVPANQLHVYNPLSGEDLAVGLPAKPNCVSVSPDGLRAAVGHDQLISYVDLQTPELIKSIPATINAADIVLAGNGFAYITEDGYGFSQILRAINLETGVETPAGGYADGARRARLHPHGDTLYALTGSSPAMLGKYDIQNGPATYLYPAADDYGGFYECSNLWFSDDGARIFTACGNVLRSSDARSEDMIYSGSFGNICIQHLVDSQAANRIALIPSASQWGDSDARDTEIRLYDYEYTGFLAKRDLPGFSVGEQTVASHGRFVFTNSPGDMLFVILQADSSSGLLLDYGVTTLPVKLDEAPPTIRATAGIGGTIYPSGEIVATPGDSLPFVITPETGYELSEVVIDGSSVGAIRAHTFESVNSSHTIEAVFKPVDNQRIRFLNHRPIDAEYSKQLDRVVTVATQPGNRLHIYDPKTGNDVGVDLPLPPSCVSVGPDGLHAAVGHNGWLSYIDLTTPSLIKTIRVTTDVSDVVLAGNGYAYAVPRAYQSDRIRCVNLETGEETPHLGGYYTSTTRIKLHPDGNAIYEASISDPLNLLKYDITDGTARYASDSRYHGSYSVCYDLWMSEDGFRIFTACGSVYRSSPNTSEDMTYNGSLASIGRVVHLDHSAEANEVVAVNAPSNSYYEHPGPAKELALYDYDTLSLRGKLHLPPVKVSGSSYAAYGKFAFFNDEGSSIFALFAADDIPEKTLNWGVLEFPADLGPLGFTINTLPGSGGTISPPTPTVDFGDSQTFVIAEDPGYEISEVLVDGVSVGRLSEYTFESVTSDHTIEAFFSRFADYFGMDLGNSHRYSSKRSPNGREANVLEIDTTTFSEPHYVIQEQGGDGTVSRSWYRRASDGLWLRRTEEGSHRLELAAPLLIIKPSLAGGDSWSSETTAKIDGSEIRLRLDASAAGRTLIETPGGTFLAYPITYRYTLLSGQKKKSLPRFTEWFAPYVGTVETKDKGGTSLLSSFAIGGGLLTDPPPIVTGIEPTHARVGDPVTVSGMYLGASSESAILVVGGVPPADIVSWTDEQIVFRVSPEGAFGPVLVTRESLKSNDDVTFHLDVPPVAAGVSPAQGAPGSVITLTGTNFGLQPGMVTIGGLRASIRRGGWSETSIVCKVSKKLQAGVHDVTVATALGSSTLPAAFTVAGR